jgi:GT2 family glycosyltransferase
MAFRRSVFEKYGGFRVDLGPTPSSQIRNEDSELGRRLLAAGERLRYEPSAIVYHPVPQGRITKEYFFSWWFDFGRARIREIGVWPDVYGIPRDYLRLLRCAMGTLGLTVRWMLAIDAKDRFSAKCWVWHQAGMIAELYSRSVDPKRKEMAGIQLARVSEPHKPERWT